MNPSHPLGDQPIEEMAPSIRGVRKAPCAHLVAARHARVQRVFGNVDTQYPVDHCPILLPCLFSKSSASNNLVRRIYAHARPKIPSNLHSGAWKTGPNLPHGLIRQRDARGSPFSSQLSKMCLFAKQSATYKGRGLLPAPARIRTCSFPAYGSYLRCLTAKRWSGQGWRIRGFGSQSSISRFIAAQVRPALWLRRESALRNPR